MTDSVPGSAATNGYSTRHPHEPEVPPTLDDEGRCLVCKALVGAEDLGYMRAQAVPVWLNRSATRTPATSGRGLTSKPPATPS